MSTPSQRSPEPANPYPITLGVITTVAIFGGIIALSQDSILLGSALLIMGGLALIITLAVQAILWQTIQNRPRHAPSKQPEPGPSTS